MAFETAESELYQLVVVARHYIDLLPIDSTRGGQEQEPAVAARRQEAVSEWVSESR